MVKELVESIVARGVKMDEVGVGKGLWETFFH